MLARIAKNAAAQSLSQLVQFADRFLVVGILIRSWGTEGYSEWALLLSFIGLLSLGELGLNIYYGNIYQKAWAAADPKRFQRMISIAIACSGVVAVLLGCFALILLATGDLRKELSIKAMPHIDAIAVAVLMGAMTLSRIARGAISQIYRGRQEFAIGIMIDLLSPATGVLIASVAGLLGAGPATVAGGYLASDVIAGWGGMVWSLNKRYPDLHIKPDFPTREELLDLVHHVKWLAVQQGSPLLWLQVPVLLLGHARVASASLVSFVVVRTLVNLMRSLGTMTSVGLGVETAAIHHAGRADEAMRFLQTVGLALSIFSAAMAVGLLAFGQPLISLWTGRSELYDRAIVFSLLASGVLAAPLAPIASHLMLANNPRPLSIALLVQLAIGLTACAILAHAYGAQGAAAGLAFGEGIAQAVVLPVLVSKLLTGVDFLRYCLRCLLAMIVTGIWCGGVGRGVIAVMDSSGWIGLFRAGTVWTMAGFVPALLLGIPAGEREVLAKRLGLSHPRATKSAS